MFKIQFPREVGNPKRYVVKDMTQFLEFINMNMGISNIYTNIYDYEEYHSMFPDYDTPIIDKIYFDIDQKIRENGKIVKIPAYENMLKIHKWCLENDYIHFPQLTGSAYDVIIATEPDVFIQNKKECVANAQLWLCKYLKIKTDPQVIGDTSRIHRVSNTFNHKPGARRYCIPLDKDIIYLGEEKLFEIAKKQRFTNNWYGNKYWDISEFDVPERKYRDILPMPKINIDEKEFSDLSSNIPDCVKNLLSRKDLVWRERGIVINCLKDNCYLLGETIEILRKHLSHRKFVHCMQSEKQPQYLYRNERFMFPHQTKIIELNACPCLKGQYCEKAKYGCLMYGRSK